MSRLALTSGAVVMVDYTGPSDVDASDPRRFRTVILAGKAGLQRRTFLAAEVSAQRRRRWLQVPAGTGTQGVSTLTSNAGAAAIFKLVAPRDNTYVVMYALGGLSEVADNVGPSSRAVVARVDNAFRQGRPLILAVLGPRH